MEKIYIVYITINLINKKSYIGVHSQSTEGFDGYIGCGINSKNSSHLLHPKTHFQYAVKKYGYSKFHRIDLAVFDNAEAAYNLERQLVTEDWVNNTSTYNMTIGGGGTREGKSATIAVLKYDMDGNFIEEFKSLSEAAMYTKNATRSEISKSCKSKYYTAGGFAWRYKTGTIRSKIDIVKPNRARPKAVMQYSLDGEFIAEYESVTKAANAVRTAGRSEISKACKSGTLSSGGYLWRYKTDKQELEIKKINRTYKKKLAQYDLDGNLVKVYDTVNQARDAGFSMAGACARGKQKTHKGFIFKFVED